MNPKMDEQIRQWIDKSISEADAAELLAELRRDPDLLREARRHYRLHRLLEAQHDLDGLAIRLLRSIAALQDSSAAARLTGRIVKDAPLHLTREFQADENTAAVGKRAIEQVRWPRWLALAASLAILAGGVWLGLRPTGALGLRVAEASGEWSVVSGQWSVGKEANSQQPTSNNQHPSETRAVVGMEIRQGERVVVGKNGKVGLKYDGEETKIELMAATEAGFGAEKGAKRVTLEAGKLVCTAAPQKKSLEIKTRHAVARVVGTRFSLDVVDKQSRLVVQEGRVAFAQGEKSVTVSAGEAAVATATGVKRDGGVVYAWGNNQFGLLGVGTTNGVVTAPMRVTGLDGVSTVIAGLKQRMFALRNDGSVWTWGGKKEALLGKYIPFGPVPVPNLAEATAVAYCGGPGLALTRDGTVWDLGMNRLGDGTTNHLPMPVQVSGLSDVIAIAAGQAHSLAVTRDGTVWSWGQNNRGQLGDGTTNSRAYPVPAKLRDGTPLGSVVAVAAGAFHSVALRRDGSIWSWGSDDWGQCDGMARFGTDLRAPERVTGLDDVTAIAVQGDRTVALRADGTVYAFGNFYGNPGVMLPGGRFYQPRLADGSPLSNVIAIANGFNNTVALRSDGSVWSWGLVAGPIQARLPDGAPLSRITAIAAGGGYTLAVGEE